MKELIDRKDEEIKRKDKAISVIRDKIERVEFARVKGELNTIK